MCAVQMRAIAVAAVPVLNVADQAGGREAGLGRVDEVVEWRRRRGR